MLRGHALDWRPYLSTKLRSRNTLNHTFISPPPPLSMFSNHPKTYTYGLRYVRRWVVQQVLIFNATMDASIVSCTQSHRWLKQQPAHLALNQTLHALAGIFGKAIRKTRRNRSFKNTSVTMNRTLSNVNAAWLQIKISNLNANYQNNTKNIIVHDIRSLFSTDVQLVKLLLRLVLGTLAFFVFI